jgi:hypothetical protein
MKKRLSGLSKTAAAVQVLGLGLLLLISCNNILISPREGAGNGQTGTVTLSFGNGVEGARTLLPSGVSFKLYKLTITSESGQTKYEDVDSASPAPIELAPGTWNIHVDAYTDTGGINKAAEGDSEPFVISVDEITPVSITLNAVTGEGNGTLSVDISVASGVSYGFLSIFDGTDFNDPVEFFDGSNNTTFAYIGSGGLDLDIPLPAGQYRVRAEIYNEEGGGTYINEVAYIYSNLITGLAKVIGTGDFVAVTTISGTVQYQENGVDQSGYSLWVYTNPDGTGNSLGRTGIESSGAHTYTLKVPRPDKDVPLYFYIDNHNGIRSAADTLTLSANQLTAVKIISFNCNVKTLSGSISVTIGDFSPASVDLRAEKDGEYSSYNATVSGGSGTRTWTMNIPLDFSGTLNFNIHGYLMNGSPLSYSVSNIGSWISGSSTTGINLTASLVMVSGSFTVTENEGPVSGYTSISAYREETPGSGNYVYLEGLGFYEGAGAWTYVTKALSPAAAVRIEIRIENIGKISETIDLGTSNVTIEPKAYALVKVSGSFAVTENGYPVSGGSVQHITAYKELQVPPEWAGDVPVPLEWLEGSYSYDWTGTTCNWTFSTLGLSPAADVLIDISISTIGRTNLNIATERFNLGISNVTVPFKTYAYTVLSGSIGEVTVNGQPPDSVQVYTYSDGIWYYGSVSGTDWQISGIPGDFDGTLTIGVGAEYANVTYMQDTTVTWTSGFSTTDIFLGDVSYTVLSGSIGMVKVNGQPPDSIEVYAHASDGSYDNGSWVSSEGTWQVSGIPGDFDGTITIGVRVKYAGSWHEKDITTWSSGDSKEINLGNVSFSSMGGTVTTNGSSPLAQGELYVFGEMPDPESAPSPLGEAEIVNGNFSGFYDSSDGATLGYVAVVVKNGDHINYYVTSSKVTLGTSMSLNLSDMDKATGN